MSDPEPLPRHPPVAWLSPRTLLGAARESVVSALFARYADKREIEGGLGAEVFDCRPGDGGAAWIDYTSDIGEGWASTYAIAHLLARPALTVEGEATQRGRVLVLGGDEVYPSASMRAYEERFRGPYKTALPEDPSVPGDDRPVMFALPGNHDWYDGLTAFMRLFTQGAGIGGWRTRQKRSYFAVEVADGWWLWGIDTQFDTYIDAPQLEYFQAAAERLDGGRVILATAKPSWVGVGARNRRPQSWLTLAFVEERIIGDHGSLALTVTGDLHHYSRYSPPGGGLGSKITAGGGGAYLSATHWLPAGRDLPPLEDGPTVPYRLERRWPEADESRALARGIRSYAWPWVTPTLGVVLGGVTGALALLLSAGVKDQERDFEQSVRAGAWDLLGDALTSWFVLAALLLVAGFGVWARSGRAARWYGWLHGVLQVATATALTLAVLKLDWLEGIADDGFALGYATTALVALLSLLTARWILTLYLVLAQRRNGRWHAEEVFAGQSRTAGMDFKHFLRFRIAGDNLTMWVVGVRQVPRRWTDGAPPEPVDRALEVQVVDRLSFDVARRPAPRGAGSTGP